MSSNGQSGVIVHVRGHSRGGRRGTVDVSAYDRSPPGGGEAGDSGDRAWERQSNAEFRDAIAKAERSAEHYNHGYRQYNEGGGGRGAFGRYQLRQKVFMAAGWMDKLGRWTEKAASSHEVKNDVDFLDPPEAQEQAMTDVLRVYDKQIRAFGLDGVCRSNDQGRGWLAVARVSGGHHCRWASRRREGCKRRFRTHDGKQKGHRRPGYKTDRFVAKRLREFESVRYQ